MSESPAGRGLSLAPMRALRYTAGPDLLGALLCPPYDVIDDAARQALLDRDPDNAVRVVLPRAGGGGAATQSSSPGQAASDDDASAYLEAARLIADWEGRGIVAVDQQPALYVYEMRIPGLDGSEDAVTRGLVGAVELRDPADGVILPHENTMAGPVADRLALMDATNANLEPIYLVYDGGGIASQTVATAGTEQEPPKEKGTAAPGRPALIATATTVDGVTHRLWAVTDPSTLTLIQQDLSQRRALIADGHHRYATYRQLAAQRNETTGPGPWNRGLALLVDSSTYGPQVHPIHRVIPGLSFDDAVAGAGQLFTVTAPSSLEAGLAALAAGSPRPAEQTDAAAIADAIDGLDQAPPTGDFTVLLTDGESVALLTDPDPAALQAARGADEPAALLDLDVTVLHRVLIERAWGLLDDEFHVRYAHDVDEALERASAGGGIAVLLRATPVDAVAAVAAAGARMPRKSTFFTPKPASGLVMRRFGDQMDLPSAWL